MQTVNLPFFSPSNNTSDLNSQTKERTSFQSQLEPLEYALKSIFSQNIEENTVIKMRRMLGEKAKNFSDEQVGCIASEFQFLITTWLDEFEREVFNGMTLKEVINER